MSKKIGNGERFLKFYSNLWKGKEMERNAVQFRYFGKERESFPDLIGRKGKEMLSKKMERLTCISPGLKSNNQLLTKDT